jgi:hypothetical protein
MNIIGTQPKSSVNYSTVWPNLGLACQTSPPLAPVPASNLPPNRIDVVFPSILKSRMLPKFDLNFCYCSILLLVFVISHHFLQ